MPEALTNGTAGGPEFPSPRAEPSSHPPPRLAGRRQAAHEPRHPALQGNPLARLRAVKGVPKELKPVTAHEQAHTKKEDW
jgi:hypothetical protein